METRGKDVGPLLESRSPRPSSAVSVCVPVLTVAIVFVVSCFAFLNYPGCGDMRYVVLSAGTRHDNEQRDGEGGGAHWYN